MSDEELVVLVRKIDQLTIECEMIGCFSAGEELNEMAADIRYELAERDVSI